MTGANDEGEFYGINPPTANLELVARFFEKYPEYVDKAFLSVKVCLLFFCDWLRDLMAWFDAGGHRRLSYPITVHRPVCGYFFQISPRLRPHLACLFFGQREENLRRRVDAIDAKLRGTKKMDLFEPARVIEGLPIETTTQILGKLVKEGKFAHIGMSEVLDSRLVRRAHAVSP